MFAGLLSASGWLPERPNDYGLTKVTPQTPPIRQLMEAHETANVWGRSRVLGHVGRAGKGLYRLTDQISS